VYILQNYTTSHTIKLLSYYSAPGNLKPAIICSPLYQKGDIIQSGCSEMCVRVFGEEDQLASEFPLESTPPPLQKRVTGSSKTSPLVEGVDPISKHVKVFKRKI
jgi:hypothetical protein